MVDNGVMRAVLTLCAAWFLCLPAAHAQMGETDAAYQDKIRLRNGDVITGNLKELDRGKLRFRTRTMDTIYINWVDIETIDADKYVRVEKADGTYVYGIVGPSEKKNTLEIRDGGSVVEVPILSVSNIQPIRKRRSFLRRLEGSVSAGIDYKKASDVLLINLSSNVRYREQKYEIEGVAKWNETSRTEENNSSRAELTGNYTRFLQNRWFWRGSLGFERNEELGIDLRALITATAGNYLLETPTLRWEVNGGLAQNSEKRIDGTDVTSTEGLIRTSLDIFKLSVPITTLSANIAVFPSITESDRVRMNSDITLRNEIIRDLFWDLSLYATYDSKPIEGAAQDDWGIVTSIGATF